MTTNNNSNDLLNFDLPPESYSICNIKEVVQFAFISNAIWQECTNNANGNKQIGINFELTS